MEESFKTRGKIVIIDGNWRKLPLRKKIWKFLAQLLILLTERKNPWRYRRYGDDIYRQLPMILRKRPEADIEILTKLGLQIIDVRKIDIPYWNTPLEYFKYGYIRRLRFLLIALKPEDSVQKRVSNIEALLKDRYPHL
jgi:hypothetical protein